MRLLKWKTTSIPSKLRHNVLKLSLRKKPRPQPHLCRPHSNHQVPLETVSLAPLPPEAPSGLANLINSVRLNSDSSEAEEKFRPEVHWETSEAFECMLGLLTARDVVALSCTSRAMRRLFGQEEIK